MSEQIVFKKYAPTKNIGVPEKTLQDEETSCNLCMQNRESISHYFILGKNANLNRETFSTCLIRNRTNISALKYIPKRFDAYFWVTSYCSVSLSLKIW